MTKRAVLAFLLLILVGLGVALYFARQNFNNEYAAANSAIDDRQLDILATQFHITPEG